MFVVEHSAIQTHARHRRKVKLSIKPLRFVKCAAGDNAILRLPEIGIEILLDDIYASVGLPTES